MPNSGLHLCLALRALDHWAGVAHAPFPAADARATQLFLFGAVAPDLGFVPGGARRFSELAHRVRTADLARTMLEQARTPAQRAYACGWSTHVLGDIAIHPLINRAGAELDGTADAAVAVHMRLEYGLDHAMFERHERLRRVRLDGAPSTAELEHVCSAFAAVYEETISPAELVRMHGMLARVVNLCGALSGVFNAQWRRRPAHALLRALVRRSAPPKRWLPHRVNGSPTLRAILQPLRPPAWLLDAVSAQLDGFATTLDAHLRSGLAELRNTDLFTGEAQPVHASASGR